MHADVDGKVQRLLGDRPGANGISETVITNDARQRLVDVGLLRRLQAHEKRTFAASGKVTAVFIQTLVAIGSPAERLAVETAFLDEFAARLPVGRKFRPV